MVGLDYSTTSVELARNILDRRNSEGESGSNDDAECFSNASADRAPDEHREHRPIRFEVFDILRGSPEPWLEDGFDLALDKGTFDAVSLSSDHVDAQGRRGCEVYAERVTRLVRKGGYLVVTSCNWTVEELRAWIEVPGMLEFGETIDFPVFEFGGVKGQTVSTVCFRRLE